MEVSNRSGKLDDGLENGIRGNLWITWRLGERCCLLAKGHCSIDGWRRDWENIYNDAKLLVMVHTQKHGSLRVQASCTRGHAAASIACTHTHTRF